MLIGLTAGHLTSCYRFEFIIGRNYLLTLLADVPGVSKQTAQYSLSWCYIHTRWDQRWLLHKGNFRDNKSLAMNDRWHFCASLCLFSQETQVNETHYSWRTRLICPHHYLQETAVIAFTVWGVRYWLILTHRESFVFFLCSSSYISDWQR